MSADALDNPEYTLRQHDVRRARPAVGMLSIVYGRVSFRGGGYHG
jgi:hypothetical protein